MNCNGGVLAPTEIDVIYSIDGVTRTRSFSNTSGDQGLDTQALGGVDTALVCAAPDCHAGRQDASRVGVWGRLHGRRHLEAGLEDARKGTS